MKLFQAAAISSLAFAALLATTQASPLERRDGVRCQRKYVGNLYAVRVAESSGTRFGSPNDSVTFGYDVQHTLTIDKDINAGNPQLFQFDECRTGDWNVDDPPREYGQVKPLSLADATKCVTADTQGDTETDAHRLYVADCGSFDGGILQQQWFYANYIQDRQGAGPFVVLTLTGDPNNPSILPAVRGVGSSDVPGAIGVTYGEEVSPVVLALFDVDIVS